MMTLQAPYPLIQTTTVLPSPELADTVNAQQTLTVSRSINGTRYSYVKKPGLKKLVYSLVLDRQKAEELKAFVASYYRAPLLLTNHKGEKWSVYFTSNPFDFAVQGRESVKIDLEFQGSKQ